MNEERLDFDENELSEEDRAVLRAFDAMEDWHEQPSSTISLPESSPQHRGAGQAEYSDDDMRRVFIEEVEEDIARMRRMLNQLEQEDQIKPESFITFRRLGHKIRGSASAIECQPITKIAERIEEIANQIMRGQVFPVIGVSAFVYAVSALEVALQTLDADEDTHSALLSELDSNLENILSDAPSTGALNVHKELEPPPLEVNTQANDSSRSFISVDVHRLERLLSDAERFTEMQSPLESAQAQVDAAIKELRAAQERLAQLEAMIFKQLTASRLPPMMDDTSTSSLAARLREAANQKGDTQHALRKSRPRSRLVQATEAALWDELDIERYSEQDLLLNKLREAIAEVNNASTRVSIAFEHLQLVTQEYGTQALAMRNGTLLLRMVPLSVLVPHLRKALTGEHTQFEISGESIEVDQRVLEALTPPLLHLLETCEAALPPAREQESVRVWFRAQPLGDEIAIEIGFSAPVSGGAVEPLHEAIQRLRGTFSLRRNDAGGVSFHLRLARSQGAINCLLVRVNDQLLVVPFSQVQRIGDSRREQFDRVYSMHNLLGYAASGYAGRVEPALVLLQGASPITVAVTVDEVVDEVELVVKPLPCHIRRPGITNAAINGQGRALLMVDLPALVRNYIQVQPTTASRSLTRVDSRQTPPKILLADDSVYMRQVLAQMLKHTSYEVKEARDGLEALEQLIQDTPDVFLLDVEMPNLNGYALLGIMRLYPALASVKIIMLTSRSSEKHVQHAFDLGAHDYLTKPCTQETLLEAIQNMLNGKSSPSLP